MAEHPGFEIGHCSLAAEYEDLQQLAGEDSSSMGADFSLPNKSLQFPWSRPGTLQRYLTDGDDPYTPAKAHIERHLALSSAQDALNWLSSEACVLQPPSWSKPMKIYFHTPSGHHMGSATCGGLLSYEGSYYYLTAAHAVHPAGSHSPEIKLPEPQSDPSSDSDDFEMTGVEDWGDDTDESSEALTTLTSPGSRTSSEDSENEDSQLGKSDSLRSSELSIQEAGSDRTIMEPTSTPPVDFIDDTVPDICERVGRVAAFHQELDFVLVKMTSVTAELADSHEFFQNAIAMERLVTDYPASMIEDDLSDTSIMVKTTHQPEIIGHRSQTPVYTRLPGTESFQLL
ncbi:Uu.00g042840.m01.CDS01 [Anthostomella pinea]|uniref:Uu.00g042840.m01.CDS01 n=1 Tax=Anthostomella pinea TaxID=933095 RepID=A0AAI8VBN7_9PEZI|nr:Uu.00g042840.m01.CDS01 [Anthostomella pinea]